MTPLLASARDRRALAIGLAGVSLIFAVGRGLPPWQRWRSESRSAATQLKREVERAQSSIAHDRIVRDSLGTRRKRFIALAPLLVQGHTPAMGGASLASLVSTAAATSNTRLGPVRVETDAASRGTFSRVRVRAELTGDVRGVAAFVRDIERGTPLIAVRELSISQLEPSAPPERVEALRVNLTVEALMLAPRAREKGADPRSNRQFERSR